MRQTDVGHISENSFNIRSSFTERTSSIPAYHTFLPSVSLSSSHLSLADLLAFLADGDFLLVLCDQRKIRCQACHKLSETTSTSLAVGGAGPSDLSSSLSSSSSSSHSEDGFLGHYILICGVDLASNIVYYLDPNIRSHSSYCLMSSVDFDRARLSDGTDEDVIRIRAKVMKGDVKVEPIGSPAFGFERIERKKKTQQAKTTTE